MNRKIIIITTTLFLSVQVGLSQMSEKISLYIAGGGTSPQESIVGQTFEFPQLSRDIGVDFFTVFLGQEPDAQNIQDYWKIGYNVGGGLIYDLTPFLAISADFNYNEFSFDKNQLASDIGNSLQEIEIDSNFYAPYNPDGLNITQGSLSTYEIGFNVRARFPHETFRPYVLGGFGYMHVNQEVLNINYYDDYNIPPLPQQGGISFYDQIPAASYDVLMVNAGVGLSVKLRKNFQPFIQGSFVQAFTEDTSTILFPLKFGFIFTLK